MRRCSSLMMLVLVLHFLILNVYSESVIFVNFNIFCGFLLLFWSWLFARLLRVRHTLRLSDPKAPPYREIRLAIVIPLKLGGLCKLLRFWRVSHCKGGGYRGDCVAHHGGMVTKLTL